MLVLDAHGSVVRAVGIVLAVAGASCGGAVATDRGSDIVWLAPPAPAPPPAPGVDCTRDPTTFPVFDKTCASRADCALAIRQIDCCNARTAVGIARSESARFEAAKATCVDQFRHRTRPACAPPPTRIEDGNSSVQDEPIGVECRAGRCTSVLTTLPVEVSEREIGDDAQSIFRPF